MGEARCALCESAGGGEVFPCLGCETPYHESCVVQRGCGHPGCPLEGMRGRHVLPRDPLMWKVARTLWMVTLACVVAAGLRAPGAHAVGDTALAGLTLGVAFAAMLFTSLGYLRDLSHPASRLLRAEVVGRVLVLGAGMIWIVSVPQRSDTLVVVGMGMLACGVLALAFRRGRKTHHPVRRRGVPEAAFGLMMLWFMIPAVLFVGLIASGSQHKHRANTRACYANQKTLAGALEMYNLDRKAQTPFEPALYERLLSGGYLQSIPQDPGKGPGSSGNYHATRGGNGISCRAHGSIQ